MFFSLFLALCLLIFLHIDPYYITFAIFQPFAYIYFFGLQQLPFYATLRFFGPTLAKNSLVDDLIWNAQEIQWEEVQKKRFSGLSDGKVEERLNASLSSANGRATLLGSGRVTAASGSTNDDAKGGANVDLSQPLLRDWGDKVPLTKPKSSQLTSQERQERQRLNVENDAHEQLGSLLRGWNDGDEKVDRLSSHRRTFTKTNRNSLRPSIRPSLYFTNRGSMANTTNARVSFSSEHFANNERATTTTNRTSGASSLSLIDALRASELRRSTGNSLIEVDVSVEEFDEGIEADSEQNLKKKDITKSKSDSKLFTPPRHANKMQHTTATQNGKRLDRIISEESHPDGSIYISTENLKSIYMSGEHNTNKNKDTLYLSMAQDKNIMTSEAMLEDIFRLLNGMGTKLFRGIALLRVVVFLVFVSLLLYTDCQIDPGHKYQCMWLDAF